MLQSMMKTSYDSDSGKTSQKYHLFAQGYRLLFL